MNYEKKLTEYMRWYQGQVTKILNKHYEGLSKTVGSTKFASKTQQSIWAANPAFANKINNQLIAMNQDVYLKLRQGIYAGWNLADDMNDGLVHKFLNGEQYASTYVSKPLQSIYMARNLEAMEAFMIRKGVGMGLSDRVWNLTQQAKSQLELTLVNGINKGTSAADLARQTQQYLKNPDGLYRAVRNKEGFYQGKLKLSKPAQAFHPGRGVYRSSYKNALRMTGTEINMSYRMSDYHRRQNLNFVIGVRVFLSTAHPFPDICDEFQGDYPKGFLFPGWHPKCICQTESILAKPGIASKYIAGGEIPKKYHVNKIPGRAFRHTKKILPKINKATNKPYWYNYNYTNGVLNKGLAPVKVPGRAITAPKVPPYKPPVKQTMPVPKMPAVVKGKPVTKEPAPKKQKTIPKPGIPVASDRNAALQAQSNWLALETQLHKSAIKEYTGGIYSDLNYYLRFGEDAARSMQGMGDALINRIKKLTKNISGGLANAPSYEGVTWRGLGFSESTLGANMLKRLEPGKVFCDKGFMSTSFDYAQAGKFSTGNKVKIILRIQGKNGKSIEFTSGIRSEHEVLFPRNSRFQVVSKIFKETPIPHYYVELLEL